MDGVQKVLLLEWLGQEIHGAGFHGARRHRDVAVRGDKNNRNPDSDRLQLFLNLQTIAARELDVQDQAARRFRTRRPEEFVRGGERLTAKADGFEKITDGVANGGVVVHDKNSRNGLRHRNSPRQPES